MAGCKGMLDAGSRIPDSTVVTSMRSKWNETGIG